jgi:RNA polymerase sigma factor (sigma-70 family)
MMGEPTDAVLWQRAAAGEAAAFGVLFRRHSSTVYNHCFRRIGDWSQAEELTSIVFFEAWRRRKNVRLEYENALPWLLGVATNVLRNVRRSQRRHRAALERMPRERVADFAADIDARLDDERQMRAVLRVLEKLPRADLGVFPTSGTDTCAELGLAELPGSYTADVRRFAKLRDAIVAHLGKPASGTSRGSPNCVGEQAARAIVRRELDAHGYADWRIEAVAPPAVAPTGRCGRPSPGRSSPERCSRSRRRSTHPTRRRTHPGTIVDDHLRRGTSRRPLKRHYGAPGDLDSCTHGVAGSAVCGRIR